MKLDLDIPSTSIIKGDALSESIAAASIIAKVTRDRMIEELSEEYPMYDLKNNKIKVVGEIDGEISFYGCKMDLNESDVLKDITKTFEDKIKKDVSSTLNLAKEHRIDFVGVGNFIYKNNNKYFDFDNDDWNKDGLSKIDFDIEIDANLYKQGNLKGDI